MIEQLTIGEVAKRSGVAASALRFYEERGLIHSERNLSRHRRYSRAVLRRVAFIVFAQRIGLTLEEIGAELAKLPENRVPERSDWAKLSGGRSRSPLLDGRPAPLTGNTGFLLGHDRPGLCRCSSAGTIQLSICLVESVFFKTVTTASARNCERRLSDSAEFLDGESPALYGQR